MKNLQLRPALGFTLIELMIVVAIIGLLAAIAIPKFANLVVKAKEASVKGKLGALRSAISIYYADNAGWNTLSVYLLPSRYIESVPTIAIPTAPGHPSSAMCNNAVVPPAVSDWVTLDPSSPDPAWAYVMTSGELRVNCTHTDTNGTTWSRW